MALFSEWLKREQGIVDPVGLDAAKKRILGENLSDEEIEQKRIDGEARFKGNAPKVQPQQTTPVTPQPAVAKTQSTVQEPQADHYDLLDKVKKFVTDNGGSNAKIKKVLTSLDDDKSRSKANKYLQHYIKEKARVRDNWDELSTISDEESAIRYLTEGLGMTQDGGRLIPASNSREQRALGGAGMPGEGRGEPRGILFDEVQRMLDPTWKSVLEDSKEDAGRDLHRMVLKNDIPWELATKIYDMFPGTMQRSINSNGAPKKEFGIFNPTVPVEYLKDGEGKFTGETNIDQMLATDPEIYHSMFGDKSTRNRGIFLLQRLLMTGGMDEFTGIPNFFDFDGISADHIFGRSKGKFNPDGSRKDSPKNLALVRRAINQFKIPQGDSADGLPKKAVDIGGKGLLGTNKGVQALDGDVPVEELVDNPEFMKWLVYRLSQKDMNVPKPGLQGIPQSIEELLDLDSDEIQDLSTQNLPANPFGLGFRNMSMMNPTHADNPGDLGSPNTWGGQPALNSYGYEGLDGYRRALGAHGLFHPDVLSELQDFENELDPEMEEDKRAKAINKKRADIADGRLFKPQKAIAGLYSLGRLSSEEFVEELRKFAKSRLNFGSEDQQEIIQKLMQGIDDEFDQPKVAGISYLDRLKGSFGDTPHRYSDDQLTENFQSPYMGAVMGSNFGRSKMPPEMVESYDEWARSMANPTDGSRRNTNYLNLINNLSDGFVIEPNTVL